jgi:Tetratricopeptide repeat
VPSGDDRPRRPRPKPGGTPPRGSTPPRKTSKQRSQPAREKPPAGRSEPSRGRTAAPRSTTAGGFGPYRTEDASDPGVGRPPRGDAPRREGSLPGKRPAAKYRVVGTRRAAPDPQRNRSRRSAPKERPRRRSRQVTGDVRDEILRLGGSKGPRYYEQLAKAADAFARDRGRDALRMLRPLLDAIPNSPSVRELAGLAHYRVGQYPAATKELEAYIELTDALDQHPVLMDCYRAQRRWRKVDECWRELALASPSAELVTEGRIVAAGALADRGRLDEALALLTKRDKPVAKVRDHHLRLWYALADLEERAGNLPRARALFERVRREDAGFADVAERLAALG